MYNTNLLTEVLLRHRRRTELFFVTKLFNRYRRDPYLSPLSSLCDSNMPFYDRLRGSLTGLGFTVGVTRGRLGKTNMNEIHIET